MIGCRGASDEDGLGHGGAHADGDGCGCGWIQIQIRARTVCNWMPLPMEEAGVVAVIASLAILKHFVCSRMEMR